MQQEDLRHDRGSSLCNSTTSPIGEVVDRGDRSLLENVEPTSRCAGTTTVTSSLRSFGQTVWITESDIGLVVDETPLVCHGGLVHMVWHIGNLEPIVKDAGIHLVARLDGEPVGALPRGTTVSTWGDDPAAIHAVMECVDGEHLLDLYVRTLQGGWGFPYVVNRDEPPPSDLVVNSGFVVTEIWDANTE